MTDFRKIVRNIASRGVFSLLAHGLMLFTFIFIARTFGAQGLGHYTFAIAFTGILSIACDPGFTVYSVREVARDRTLEPRYFGAFLFLAGLIAPGCLLLIIACIFLFGWGDEESRIIVVVGSYQILFLTFGIVRGRFEAHNEMVTVGALEAGLRLFILAAVVLGASAGMPLHVVLLSMPLGMILWSLVAWLFLSRNHPSLRLRMDVALIKSSWRHVWPFGLAVFLGAGYAKVDILMLGFLTEPQEVGIYAAANRLIMGILVLVAIAAWATFPAFSKLFQESKERMRGVFERVLDHMALLCGCAALVLAALAEQVISVLYADKFTASSIALALLSLLLPVKAVSTFASTFLDASNHERISLRGRVYALVLNILLNLVLIMMYGYLGAIAATITSEVFLLAYYAWQIKLVGYAVHAYSKALRILFGMLAFAGVWYLLHPHGLLLILPAGLLAYFTVIALCGGIRWDDFRDGLRLVVKPRRADPE